MDISVINISYLVIMEMFFEQVFVYTRVNSLEENVNTMKEYLQILL